jgi:hypothetical protein
MKALIIATLLLASTPVYSGAMDFAGSKPPIPCEQGPFMIECRDASGNVVISISALNGWLSIASHTGEHWRCEALPSNVWRCEQVQ